MHAFFARLRTHKKTAVFILSTYAASSSYAARRGDSEITRDGLPNIKSAAAFVVDLGSDQVLFERDADAVRPIASLSKMVSALVIQTECRLDPEGLHEMTQGNREAAKGGDKSKLTTGWSYSHKDLMHAALMRSDNRALPALGEACGLSPAALGEKMTVLARRLGLNKTEFKEPNGLSPENVSTARELVTILKEVVKVPDLTDIMLKREYTLVAHKEGRPNRPIRINNTDRLLSKNVAQIIGAKTGYTDLARYCFAVAAKTDLGHELGMIFLGGEGRFTRFADFTRVIKWFKPEKVYAKQTPPVTPDNATTTADESIKGQNIEAGRLAPESAEQSLN
jgi:D-alanyl-D-alanine endopeptidase (penicillin-binding protein 7)